MRRADLPGTLKEGKLPSVPTPSDVPSSRKTQRCKVSSTSGAQRLASYKYLMTKIVGDDKGDNTVFPGEEEMKSCSINFREVWEEAREERLGNSSPNRPNLLL